MALESGRTTGFPCKQCGAVFPSMPRLLEHRDRHAQDHADDDRRFRCEECGRGYRHAGSLANHRKTHEVGSFHCRICQRSLSNALALKSHLRTHTATKKHGCPDCGKAFRLATQLATHQKVHRSKPADGRAGALPPPLDFAPLEEEEEEEEEEQDSLLGEERAAGVFLEQREVPSGDGGGEEEEGGGGDRPFKCDQCDKSYRHPGSLVNHRRRHTLGVFECSVCFKSLGNLAALHSHQRIHSRSRSAEAESDATPRQLSPPGSDAPLHFCHLCQVLFPDDADFQEHVQMHNSSSAVSFGLCGGSSEERGVSYDHSVPHSPDSTFYSPPLNDAPSLPFSVDNGSLSDASHEQIGNGHLYSDHSGSEAPFAMDPQGEPLIHDSASALAEAVDGSPNAEESSAADSGERRFKCQVCGKSYRHAGSLINHKRSHQMGVYQCSVCRKSYPHLAALRSHVRIHRAAPTSFSLGSDGDWLSPEPLTLDTGCFASPGDEEEEEEEEEEGHGVGLAQENAEQLSNGVRYDPPGQFDSGFPPPDRAVHLPHDLTRLMDSHMCADCGETFADIAGIKSHACPLLQHHQHGGAVSHGYNGAADFRHANGQSVAMMGTPGDHAAFQGFHGSQEQRYFEEGRFHDESNEPLPGGGLEEDGDGEDEEEDDGELYQCSVCGNRYTSMRALRTHLRGHTQAHGTPASSGPSSMSSLEEERDEEPAPGDAGCIICGACGESFPRRQDLLAHQLLHAAPPGPAEERQSIICGSCGVFCSSYHHLETHRCSARADAQPSSSNNNNNNNYTQTVKAEGGEGSRRGGSEQPEGGEAGGRVEADDGQYRCEPGGQVEAADRQYRCEQCGRAYRHAGSLLNHKKSHKTGVFRCFVCQKRFYNLLALKNHQRTHFDVKRHTCHECGKAFKIQKQLLNHLRIHKQNQAKIQELNAHIQALLQMNGPASAATATAKPRGSTRRSAKSKQKAAEGEVKAEGGAEAAGGDPRPYSCDQCGRSYRHAGSLVNHRNSHKTGEYYCSVCSNTYPNQLAMKNHLRIHFALKKHCCPACGKGFRVKRQLASHVCAHLKKPAAGGGRRGLRPARDFKCGACGRAFVSAERLAAHVCGGSALKKEARPFTCGVCNRSYRHAGSLLNHKNTHKTGSFSCSFCSKPFGNPMALRNHTRIHTQNKKHACLTCGKAFRLASILHNHQKVHNRVAGTFSCAACRKSFQGKSGLKRHRCQSGADPARAGSHSQAADRCFMCDLCGRSYRHAGSLLNHKKSHSESLHQCSLCLQTFPDPHTLRLHSQMTRHCCPDCGKTFCLLAHLQSHAEVHRRDRQRALRCSPCQQSFPSPAELQQHQELQRPRSPALYPHPGPGWPDAGLEPQTPGLHGMPKLVPALSHGGSLEAGGGGVAAEEKSHVCEHCGRTYRHAGSLLNHKNSHKTGSFSCSACQKEFSNLMALKNHRRIHTEPKRYQCLECGKAFRVSTQLLCHRRIHTKEKPFACALCDKRFSSKSNLRHHQRMHQSPGAYEAAAGAFGLDDDAFLDLDMSSFL